MSLILNIETSTELCSVALSFDGELLLEKNRQEEGFVHAEALHVLIEELFKESGKNLDDLLAIAVSSGPGSYTGLRIGVSAGKGLAYGLNKPLISVSALESMTGAVQKTGKKGLFCPMIDARRMEVYTALYNEKMEKLVPFDAKIIDGEFLSDYKNNSIYIYGNGAEKCSAVLPENFHFIPEIHTYSKYMIPISHAKYLRQEFEDLISFEPDYFKEFVAGPPKKIV